MPSFWDSVMPASPQAAHLKRTPQTALQALSAIMSAPSSPNASSDCSSSTRTSTSSSDWDACTTPPSSPAPSIRGISGAANARKRKLSEPAKVEAADHVKLHLLFGHGTAEAESSPGPPAFFPSQRVAFSPKLRVHHKRGLRLDANLLPNALRSEIQQEDMLDLDEERMCGMMLGVTGVVEQLSPNKYGPPIVKSSRLIADFCTDLTNGVKIWQKDAAAVVEKRAYACCQQAQPTCDHKRKHRQHAKLPSGTYVLPLSMKIPASDRLPPSFESEHFRLRYTITLALFSTSGVYDDSKKPSVLALVNVPFQILPSTTPTIAPTLPTLTHNPSSTLTTAAASLVSSLSKLVSSAQSETKEDEAIKTAMQEWHVETSVPTSTYNPSEVVPITLSLRPPISNVACSGAQHIFIRLTLLRRLYVRESSLSFQQDTEWGFGLGQMANEEYMWERWEREEKEICQRWGILTLPASATPSSATRTVLRDIQMPIAGMMSGANGYSTTLDLEPHAGRPTLVHGDSSWFSPTVKETMSPSNAKAFDKHLHVSSRFFVAVEIGFASAPSPVYQQYGSPIGEFVIRTAPSPFAPRRPAACQKPAFVGKLRELLVPITIGSVAEPASLYLRSSVGMARDTMGTSSTPIGRNRSPPTSRIGEPDANRNSSDWQGVARGPTALGEDSTTSTDEHGNPILDAWICPPPHYEEALESVPAYGCF